MVVFEKNFGINVCFFFLLLLLLSVTVLPFKEHQKLSVSINRNSFLHSPPQHFLNFFLTFFFRGERERGRGGARLCVLVVVPAVHVCQFPEARAPVVEVIVVLVAPAAGRVEGAEGAGGGAAALVVEHEQGVVGRSGGVVVGRLQSLCGAENRVRSADKVSPPPPLTAVHRRANLP